MKTSDIKVKNVYRVRVPELDCTIYKGCDLDAKVVRTGFHYDVEVVTASRVRGAPFHRFHKSAHPNGVEIEWDEQEVLSNRRRERTERVRAGRAIVNSRAVLFEITREEVN